MILTALVLAAAPPQDAGPHDPVIGRWSNPRRTLAVETRPCPGGTLCGTIVWASPHAVAEARAARLPALVGTPLLRGYRHVGSGHWAGRIFVPDMGHSYPSHIRQSSPASLTISQCLVGGFLCTSQVWHRIG